MRAFSRSLLGLCFAVMFFLLPVFGVRAQEKAATAALYANEPFVVDRSDWLYVEKGDGTGYREHTVAVTVQADASLRVFGVVAMSFASASEHVEIHYARVRHKDGTVTETPVTDAQEQPEQVTREAPFYSDLKQMQLPIKNLRVGDTLEWQARIIRTRAEAPGQFWGGENFVDEGAVTLEEAIELRVPEASAATVWTNPRAGAQPVISNEGGVKIVRWTTAQLKPTTGIDADVARKAKKTTLLTADEETEAEQGKLPSVAWTSFKDWETMGAWYRKLEGDRPAPDDEMKAKVTELTAGKATEEEKVRAVYAYVSSQIRYIGVAFGVGRLQPHAAADVLHNQYGDCKDKATLLSAMLAALALPSDAVLIGAGVRFNPAVASPASFNHMITRVRVGGQEVWLDSTEEVAPYKMLAGILRDRQALIVPGQGTASIERTPKDPPFPAADLWTSKGTITKDGVSDSHMVLTFRGDDELVMRSVVHQVPPSSYEEMIQKLLQNFGYMGTSSHGEVTRPEDTAGPFTITLDYHRELGSAFKDLQILGQVAPVLLPTVSENEPPVQAIQLGTPRTELSQAEMKLPEGWGAQLPEAIHQKTAWVTYDMTYRLDKGTLYTERKIVVLQPKVPATDWKLYKKWADAVGLGLENYIVLVPAGGLNKTSKPAAPNIENAEAAQRMQEAMNALQQDHDAEKAESLLNKAKALNPHEPRLHAAYAYLFYMKGQPRKEIEEANEELKVNPSNVQMYGYITSAQILLGDTASLEATYRKWLEADPGNTNATLYLAQSLLTQKRNSDAVQLIEKSMQAMGEEQRQNDRLQLMLGRAQLKSSMKEQGTLTLTTLLKKTDDPSLVNDAVYELADAGVNLGDDEERQKAALDKLEDETATWTLDEAPATVLGKTALLEAAWDTMGWIYFREHKLTEARNYIDAAYANQPDADVSSHYQQLHPEKKIAPGPARGNLFPSSSGQEPRLLHRNPGRIRWVRPLSTVSPNTNFCCPMAGSNAPSPSAANISTAGTHSCRRQTSPRSSPKTPTLSWCVAVS